MFLSGTNNKGVCNMFRIRPSFHSLSFGYLPQPAHMNFLDKLSKTFGENGENTLVLPSRWRIIDNRNNLYYIELCTQESMLRTLKHQKNIGKSLT